MDKYEKARYLMTKEVSEATEDELLKFNFDLIEAQVLEYCNRWDFPTGLMLIVIQMVAEYTKANFYKNKVTTDKEKGGLGKVKSVTRGDTTISYGDDATVTEYAGPNDVNVDEFMRDYEKRLIKYRKIRTV